MVLHCPESADSFPIVDRNKEAMIEAHDFGLSTSSIASDSSAADSQSSTNENIKVGRVTYVPDNVVMVEIVSSSDAIASSSVPEGGPAI